MPLATEQHFAERAPTDRDLWRAVIGQAITDAVSRERSGTARLDKARARRWLQSPSRDFDEVCALAELEPDPVRRLARQRIQQADAADLARSESVSTGGGVEYPAVAS